MKRTNIWKTWLAVLFLAGGVPDNCMLSASVRAQGVVSTNVPATAPQGNTIAGVVLDTPGGRGVANVKVTLSLGYNLEKLQTTVSDAQGRYEFHNVPAGGTLYRVYPGEYGPGIWTEDSRIDLTGATNFTATAAPLYTRLTTVSGRVTELRTGLPAAGVEISFPNIDRTRAKVFTDANGAYRLLTVPHPMDLICRGNDDQYYPVDVVQKVEMIEGVESSDNNFLLLSATAFTGQVFLPDGKPAAGMAILVIVNWTDSTVQAHQRINAARQARGLNPAPDNFNFHGGGPSDGAGIGKGFRLVTDGEGKFTGYRRRPIMRDWEQAIDIHVYARSSDYKFGGLGVEETTTLDGETPPIEVHLSPARTVELTISGPNGQPVPDAKLTNQMRVPGGSYTPLSDLKEIVPDYVNLGRGRYRATGLMPGVEYQIAATAGNMYSRVQLLVSPQSGDVRDGVLSLIPRPAPSRGAPPRATTGPAGGR